MPLSWFPLKSQTKNSGPFQDFSGNELPKNQHRFRAQPMNLIAKQEIVKLKMQCQCNTSFLSIATTIAIALLNINDDK